MRYQLTSPPQSRVIFPLFNLSKTEASLLAFSFHANPYYGDPRAWVFIRSLRVEVKQHSRPRKDVHNTSPLSRASRAWAVWYDRDGWRERGLAIFYKSRDWSTPCEYEITETASDKKNSLRTQRSKTRCFLGLKEAHATLVEDSNLEESKALLISSVGDPPRASGEKCLPRTRSGIQRRKRDIGETCRDGAPPTNGSSEKVHSMRQINSQTQ